MGARILVIEDNRTNHELISYLLRAYGHEVLTSLDGAASIEVAERERPDLIICDIQMRGIDGYEVARRLRADAATRAIPLVAVTALAMVDDRRKVLEAGFDGYISKPIEPERFLSQIAPFLGKEVSQAPRHAGPAVAKPPNPPCPRGVAVLVVDNSPDNVGFVRALLEPAGYRVWAAGNITEGLALARRAAPDLILSDLHMPGGDGFQLLRAAKADPGLRGIPFVCLSSTIWPDADRKRAIELGAARFLHRPIEPQALLSAIEAVLAAAGR